MKLLFSLLFLLLIQGCSTEQSVETYKKPSFDDLTGTYYRQGNSNDVIILYAPEGRNNWIAWGKFRREIRTDSGNTSWDGKWESKLHNSHGIIDPKFTQLFLFNWSNIENDWDNNPLLCGCFFSGDTLWIESRVRYYRLNN